MHAAGPSQVKARDYNAKLGLESLAVVPVSQASRGLSQSGNVCCAASLWTQEVGVAVVPVSQASRPQQPLGGRRHTPMPAPCPCSSAAAGPGAAAQRAGGTRGAGEGVPTVHRGAWGKPRGKPPWRCGEAREDTCSCVRERRCPGWTCLGMARRGVPRQRCARRRVHTVGPRHCLPVQRCVRHRMP
jgi:hypothetical protein